jgi:hypothetical protein
VDREGATEEGPTLIGSFAPTFLRTITTLTHTFTFILSSCYASDKIEMFAAALSMTLVLSRSDISRVACIGRFG